jgi:hypothetical protein
VKNWEAFDGTLLTVCFVYADRYVVEGTAVMIGLGLALSAKHVIDDHLDALIAGQASLYCDGMRLSGKLDIWECYALTTNGARDTGDLELLSLKLVSDIPGDGRFVVAPLTTRIPPPGELVTVAGFRFEEPVFVSSLNDPVTLAGRMYMSQGFAGEFSNPIHDSVLAPYPTIEILSGALGGMSGGAVLDRNGHLIGVTSLSLESGDQEGPTLAAWWMQAYCWRLSSHTWPSGVHYNNMALCDMQTVQIVGREYVQVLDESNFELNRWV